MAQKVSVVLVDDLDGNAADETVSFGLDGTTYEIDLSKANAAKLRDALARYVAAGRRASRSTGGRGRGRSSRGSSGVDTAAVRAWAKKKNIKVSERGRISGAVLARYESENS